MFDSLPKVSDKQIDSTIESMVAIDEPDKYIKETLYELRRSNYWLAEYIEDTTETAVNYALPHVKEWDRLLYLRMKRAFQFNMLLVLGAIDIAAFKANMEKLCLTAAQKPVNNPRRKWYQGRP